MAKGFNKPVNAAIVNGGSIRLDDILENEISAVDVFRVLPFGGNVQRVQITGELLNQVLDYGEKSAGTGAYLHRYNLKNKNGIWFLGSKPLENDTLYTVALSDYLLKGLDIPILSADSPGIKSVYIPIKEEAAYDIRKAVIDFMKTLK